MEYQVKLPVFEGPLDLLLHLIEKRELDVTAVSLAQVADQYLDYLSHAEELNPDSLADFVVVAAKLLVIKSFALLPSRNPLPEEEEVAHDLTTALLEYQLFKRAAQGLREMEESGRHGYGRSARPVLPPPAVVYGAMDPGALLQAMLRLMDAAMVSAPSIAVPRKIYTVAEKIELIDSALTEQTRVAFSTLLARGASRLEIIVTFLALLELLKKGHVEVEQAEHFGEISLLRPNALSPQN